MSTFKNLKNSKSDNVQRWQYPAIDKLTGTTSSSQSNKRTSGPVTAEQIEKIQHEAYKEAYEAGFTKGREEATIKVLEQNNANIIALEKILAYFSQPLEDLDTIIEDQLLQLVVLIAKQIIRRELKTDSGQIVAVVRDTVSLLPLANRPVYVRLHPDDLTLIKESIAIAEDNNPIHYLADVGLNRGDCIVSTETSNIDASIENRVNSIIAGLLGGERKDDS